MPRRVVAEKLTWGYNIELFPPLLAPMSEGQCIHLLRAQAWKLFCRDQCLQFPFKQCQCLWLSFLQFWLDDRGPSFWPSPANPPTELIRNTEGQGIICVSKDGSHEEKVAGWNPFLLALKSQCLTRQDEETHDLNHMLMPAVLPLQHMAAHNTKDGIHTWAEAQQESWAPLSSGTQFCNLQSCGAWFAKDLGTEQDPTVGAGSFGKTGQYKHP